MKQIPVTQTKTKTSTHSKRDVRESAVGASRIVFIVEWTFESLAELVMHITALGNAGRASPLPRGRVSRQSEAPRVPTLCSVPHKVRQGYLGE